MPSPANPPRTHARGAIAALCTLLLLLLAAIGAPDAPEAPGAADAIEAQPTAETATRRAAPPAPQPELTPPADASAARPTYDDAMVMLEADGATLESIAARFGTTVVRASGPSGWGALAVPPTMHVGAFASALDPMGVIAVRMGITRGASQSWPWSTHWRTMPAQWHIDGGDFPSWFYTPTPGYVVAILDTGVAYEYHAAGGDSFSEAYSLQYSDSVAPLDLVNGDTHANDDHGHGTHLASIIAADAWVDGVAPWVTLMPVKVLDDTNSGLEIDLVDGIYHAVDEGADVINLSLSFAGDYTPSPALQGALEAAADADVIVVAAAGNDGTTRVTWPAASPLVIAVGAGTPTSGGLEPTGYTNLGPKVDVIAPGGDLTSDYNGDGIPDGLLAETIDPANPYSTDLYLWAGTSQAAAVVSGAALHYLSLGFAPDEVACLLHRSGGAWDFLGGTGAGPLQLEAGVGSSFLGTYNPWSLGCRSRNHRRIPCERTDYAASILPFLSVDAASDERPSARVSVVTAAGQPATGVTVVVAVDGSHSGTATCTVGSDGPGECTAILPLSASEAGAISDDASWSLEVVAVLDSDGAARPTSILFATDELELVASTLSADPSLAGGVLAFEWFDETDPDLGDIGAALSVVNHGSGISTSPLGVLLKPGILSWASTSHRTLDLDGTGISTSPLGFFPVKRIVLGGTGISTSPLGLNPLTLVAFRGTGISTSPLGFRGLTLASRSVALQTMDVASTTQFLGHPVYLTSGTTSGPSLAGSALAATLASGGWVSGAGMGGASSVTAQGLVPTGQSWSGSGNGTVEGAGVQVAPL